MTKKVKQAASKTMRENSEEALNEFRHCPNVMFRLVKGLRIYCKEVDGERCVRGTDKGCVSVRKKEVKS